MGRDFVAERGEAAAAAGEVVEAAGAEVEETGVWERSSPRRSSATELAEGAAGVTLRILALVDLLAADVPCPLVVRVAGLLDETAQKLR
jgi:hypothetical protein